MSDGMRTHEPAEASVTMTPRGPGSPKPSVDIVIVNWNTGPYLRGCLESVAAARGSTYELGNVVVVDNASTDGSLDRLQGIDLPLEIIRNDENRGFSVACNQGAEAGTADLILFLNPDTRLFPETLDSTVAFMANPANAQLGICGAQMLGEDGQRQFSCARFPTFTMFVAHMIGLTRVLPRWFPPQRLTPEEVRHSGIVDQVIGAYFMIRRSVFEALGGFDERFFVYLEDVDLAYRARRLGYPSYFLADVPVYHKEMASSDQVRGRRLFYLLRSRTRYARKHWPAWQAVLLAGLILTVEFPVRAIVSAVRGRPGELREVGEAARMYACYLATR
jgi:N-acetylglucosaminyl-diphospho-decaprenol L-rhamnosyltransferase